MGMSCLVHTTVASLCSFLSLSLCSKFDLYSKADDPPEPEEVKDYYQSLLDKYLPGVLKW